MAQLQAPLNVSVSGIDQGLHVSWGAVVGATRYRVYYKTAPEPVLFSSFVEVNDGLTKDVLSLPNSVTYWVAVTALPANEADESEKSTPVVSAVTGSPAVVAQPSGLVAQMKSTSVKLTWDAPGTAVSGYKIYYTTNVADPMVWTPFSGASIDGNLFASGDTYVTASGVEVTLTGLTNNSVYYLAISAVRDGIESGMSEVVRAVPLANISSFVAGNIVKIPFHTGYNIVAIPLLPSHLTTYGQLRTHLASRGTVSQMFYLDGPNGMVGVATSSTKTIQPGESVFVVTSSNNDRYIIGTQWSV